MPPVPVARWLKVALVLAGVYNLLWGGAVVLFPATTYRYGGLWTPDRPLVNVSLWQCIGMIVGVYGIAYLAASRDPVRHWPVVLAGLLSKILGPLGAIGGALKGDLPWSAVTTNLFNDFLWWLPFALILRRAWTAYRTEEGADPPATPAEAMTQARTQHGVSVAELSKVSPVLLIFLRHFG